MIRTKQKNILLIVTGGIASYKSLDLIRLLKKANYSVECVLTKSVKEFISEITFSSLLGKKVYSDLFVLDKKNKMNHIELTEKKDLVLVVPATANFIGKISNGIADDLASNLILTVKSPIFIAPAMNTGMLENKAVKYNLKKLKERNIKILEPSNGKLACGQVGKGKLMTVEKIFKEVSKLFERKTILNGKKAIVTSGPSFESLDPIRFISNYSSGIQGYEIAKALFSAGVKTKLISGPTNIKKPEGVTIKNVLSGDDFLKETRASLPADIFISAAAIGDWKIKNYSNIKLKKEHIPNLVFERNTDILKTVSTCNFRPNLVIGFAAETNDLNKNSKKKLQEKKCDWILGNLVNQKRGFGNKKNKISLFKKNEIKKWPFLSKESIAEKLVFEIINYFEGEIK